MNQRIADEVSVALRVRENHGIRGGYLFRMILADSNILIYALNVSSPKHKTAQIFLNRNLAELTIAHQNIFETLRVLTHPKFPNPMTIRAAQESVKEIIKVSQVINPDYKTHYLALELINRYQLFSDQVFDAYLAATALSNGVYTIATDNTDDFKKFVGLTIVNPFV